MGGGKAAHRREFNVANSWRGGDFFRSGMSDNHIPRRAFLQKQFRCLHDRFGVKARPHRATGQRIGDGDDRHAW